MRYCCHVFLPLGGVWVRRSATWLGLRLCLWIIPAAEQALLPAIQYTGQYISFTALSQTVLLSLLVAGAEHVHSLSEQRKTCTGEQCVLRRRGKIFCNLFNITTRVLFCSRS